MNKEFKQYYDSCEYGDIVIETIDKKRKKLHKIVLSNNSKYLKELINDKDEITIDYKWKYLEPILKYIYMGVFSFNYPNLSKDNIYFTIQDFETILHIGIHFNLDTELIKVIIDHFDYKKRLPNNTMKEICLLLTSLYKISLCSNIEDNIDIIAHLVDTIILYNLMNIDPYLTVIGEEFSIIISNQLYNNLITIGYLDNISSVTINEVMSYYIKKMREYDIPLELLYKLAKQEIYRTNIEIFTCSNEYSISVEDIKKINRIILNSILEYVLNEPYYQFKNVYYLLCIDEPNAIINKLVDFKDTNLLLDLKIEEFKKKTICQVCCDSNVDCCLKGCGHLFCHDCISELMIQNRNNTTNYTQCPLCKKEFGKYDLVTVYI